MENKLEKVLQFEGQDIKVITDKGETLYNLVETAKILGITKNNKNKIVVNWKTGNSNLVSKLNSISNTIYSGGNNGSTQYIEEINYVLEEIDNCEDRKLIFISSWLSKRLAMECKNDKAMRYKNFLATLDEKFSKGELQPNNNPLMQFGDMAQQMSIMANTMQQIGQAFNGMQTFVRDSIVAKDNQLDEMRSLIGMYSRNVSDLAKKLKQKVKEKYNKEHIWATSSEYIFEKEKLFREFNVTKWESISLIKFGEVENYIKNIK